MNKSNVFAQYCPFTGKDEKWERIETKTEPYGRGGQVTSFFHENCLNYACKIRDTTECPLKK